VGTSQSAAEHMLATKSRLRRALLGKVPPNETGRISNRSHFDELAEDLRPSQGVCDLTIGIANKRDMGVKASAGLKNPGAVFPQAKQALQLCDALLDRRNGLSI
jgi:hypothetical protein